jgi:hypothetical protein
MVIDGTFFVENETLNSRDAIGIWDTSAVTLTAKKDSKALLIEVPMN